MKVKKSEKKITKLCQNERMEEWKNGTGSVSR